MFFTLFILSCAENPSHTNIFDPDTPNDPPEAVEIKAELIKKTSTNSIEFGWTESGDDDFLQYKVYRSEQPGVSLNSTLIATQPYAFWNTIQDSALQSNTNYYYKVYVEDKGGKLSGSNEIQIQTSPEIEMINPWVSLGDIGNWGTFSKMDLIIEGNKIYIFNAFVSRSRQIYLKMTTFTYSDGVLTNPDESEGLLLGGDRDNDGTLDLVELWMGRDMDNPLDASTEDDQECPPIAATKVVVYKETGSDAVQAFVMLFEKSILKFTGNLNTMIFSQDKSWQEDGILYTGVTGMARFSDSELVLGSLTDLKVYPINKNVPTVSKALQNCWIGLISLGKDTPDGQTYFYSCDTYGGVFKFDINFNLISWQRMTSSAVSFYSCVDFHADSNGNLYVIDAVLGCINKYKSNGILISRWQETASWRNLLFTENLTDFGHVSLSGDKDSKLFIIDQSAVLYRSVE